MEFTVRGATGWERHSRGSSDVGVTLKRSTMLGGSCVGGYNVKTTVWEGRGRGIKYGKRGGPASGALSGVQHLGAYNVEVLQVAAPYGGWRAIFLF